ncbi:DUF447 domain-containing protein [Rhodopirellula sp. MGV]|uniref:DUF447 domain-containing protein n=1 Tax=Rhodopirellula sp. MGV TaxID=2023130 RepID=UPI000B96F8FE|nr:DUF447 domain-containing protein [Rhodopirellula sp. MGV]OYP35518.1 hypothetical protein CGZ80_11805 [Rhodopirellula sp. MGV]PNY34481.1 DUF447 domain-containing protein [Rhodopirellula baltica]
MILESIVTTIDNAGQVNIAPMGPWVRHPDRMRLSVADDPGFVLRPFEGSRTLANLQQSRRATIHLTDDVLLLAKAAVGRIEDANDRVRMLVPNDDLPYQHAILDPCHRWFAVEIEHIEAMPPRYEMRCRVLDQGIDAPFIGFNRAKHAVIEAAILATRIGLIDEASLRSQLEQLRIPVEKTAGDDERAAWDLITSYVDRKLSQVSVNTST